MFAADAKSTDGPEHKKEKPKSSNGEMPDWVKKMMEKSREFSKEKDEAKQGDEGSAATTTEDTSV